MNNETETAAAPVITGLVGRNAPCPCGSGKKAKRCHGAVAIPQVQEVYSTVALRDAGTPDALTVRLPGKTLVLDGPAFEAWQKALPAERAAILKQMALEAA